MFISVFSFFICPWSSLGEREKKCFFLYIGDKIFLFDINLDECKNMEVCSRKGNDFNIRFLTAVKNF